MGPLLVVLVIGCALTSAARFGRGFWSRGRSVERHRQALGTLADITNNPDAAPPARAPAPDHQAHVRVIGPSGPVPEGSLPPPRPFSRSAPANNPSPLRRPSRSAPSAAAIDAVTASASLGQSPSARLVRTKAPRPPGTSEPARPAERLPEEDATVPLLMPPSAPPPGAGKPPTRPVPLVRPHVFYFDDVTARAGRQAREGGGEARDDQLAGPAPSGPGAPAPTPSGHGSEHGPSLPKVVAAVAAVVALAAAATAVVVMERPSGKAAPVAAPRPTRPAQVAQRPTSTAAPSTTAPRPTTTKTVPVSTTKAPVARPKPAVLVSPSRGTDRYELTSAPASIVVTASGRCWIEVRAGSHRGQVITETIMKKGQVESVTGPAWIRLGNPVAVVVTLNGARLAVPGATVAVPLNLDFTLG